MTSAAEQPEPAQSALALLLRASFAKVAPRQEQLARYFYGALFTVAPDTRDLFPANMTTQRSRLLDALLHVVQNVDDGAKLEPFLRHLGRDHRKFDVVTRHYDAVGVALLATLKHFLRDDWTHQVEQAWTSAYGLIASVMNDAAESVSGPNWWKAIVLEHRKLSHDLAIVRVQPEQPLHYQPGQHVSVEVPQRPRLWRYLSPANAHNEDGTLEFHVRAVTGGWVSGAIVNHTQVGDTWRIGPALGTLGLDEPTRRPTHRKILLIAGGTGFAPFQAILHTLERHQHHPPVTLLLGAPTAHDLYGLGDMRRLADTNSWLTVTPVTEDGSVHEGFHGTLPDALGPAGTWDDHHILIAGSPNMIRSTLNRLTEHGIDSRNITHDTWSATESPSPSH